MTRAQMCNEFGCVQCIDRTYSDLWCKEHENERRARIGKQIEDIFKQFPADLEEKSNADL